MALTVRNKHVVLDNNIIFDFGALDDFTLLNRILSTSVVIISPEVKEEVKKEIKLEKLRFTVEAYTVEEDYLNAGRLKEKQKGLSEQDISCLVLAKKFRGLCATNEKLMRRVAKQEGILVIGSIGLLECAISQGILTHKQAVDVLQKTIANGAFIENKLVESFLKRR